MQPARDAQRHRIGHGQPLPIGHPPTRRRIGFKNRQQSANDARGGGRAGVFGMIGLPRNRLGDTGDVHHSLVV